MITDEIFRTELDIILKKQKITKKKRSSIISYALTLPVDNRFDILRQQEKKIVQPDKIPLESEEQAVFVEWFRKTYPDHKIIMIRNDGSRSPRERNQQLVLGLCPGAADLFIPHLHLWVEMKRLKGSKWPDEQQEFKRYVESIGHKYCLCYGANEAIQAVKSSGYTDSNTTNAF